MDEVLCARAAVSFGLICGCLCLVLVLLLMELLPGLKAVDYAVVLPLGPREVVLLPLAVLRTQRPPESGLQRCSNNLRVVALLDEVLVRRKSCSREFSCHAIRSVNLLQEHAVVPFLQVQKLLFVLRIRQVFRQLLNLCSDLLQTGRRLWFFRLRQKLSALGLAGAGQRLDLVPVLGSAHLLRVLPLDKHFVVHSPLDDQQRRRYERFLKQLGLEHFDQMLNPELLRLLCKLLGCQLLVAVLLCLLLLKEPHLRRLFQRELRVLAVDALDVDQGARCFHFNEHLQQIFHIDLARADERQQERLVGWVRPFDFQVDHDTEELGELLGLGVILHSLLEVLDVHGLAEHMFADMQLGQRVWLSMPRDQEFGLLTEVLFQDFFFPLLH